MAIQVDNRIFVDTNLLIYANLAQSPFYTQAASKLKEMEQNGAELFISRQVLREYLAVMTRPGLLTGEIPIKSLIEDVKNFETSFTILDDSENVTQKLLELVKDFSVKGRQVHDANIVATMTINDVKVLLTHNTSDFDRFKDMIQVISLD